METNVTSPTVKCTAAYTTTRTLPANILLLYPSRTHTHTIATCTLSKLLFLSTFLENSQTVSVSDRLFPQYMLILTGKIPLHTYSTSFFLTECPLMSAMLLEYILITKTDSKIAQLHQTFAVRILAMQINLKDRLFINHI